MAEEPNWRQLGTNSYKNRIAGSGAMMESRVKEEFRRTKSKVQGYLAEERRPLDPSEIYKRLGLFADEIVLNAEQASPRDAEAIQYVNAELERHKPPPTSQSGQPSP